MSLAYRLARPILFAMEAERAHDLTINLLKVGALPPGLFGAGDVDDPALSQTVFGLSFPNPVGLGAGFDKNARVPDAMLALGFGLVEAGTVTPRPQPGNPKPRLFRAVEVEGVINRFGFNNEGLETFARRLEDRRGLGRTGIVGANVGKNKDTADAASDYAIGIRRLAPLADYLVVNVSSPNTPGLRSLQGRQALSDLLAVCLAARGSHRTPLLLKVAPDLTEDDKVDVAEVALASGIDGLIVSNTTLDRPDSLTPAHRAEAGGLSGQPLFDKSTSVLRDFYRLTSGKLPLVGVGGIGSGAQAYAKIRAGASLVQIYSALIYQGPGLVTAIKRDLADLLRRDGFATVAQAVGADHR
ncbi:quinone-dependent dihydroorotate dehydrogenase [Nitrospirillum sp. BR 11164]|uniref:quinone-dependent dihydroorotate dehydrogenase n=1 Tax=Nitrospirillum sp. BR 11164 TaxID=3104324 RepID=UPI002AFECAD3|nr:quinone-dependent dihydroorotate dehydrogenase [Nitrospirillum sp. BR 11164]MEA1649426.1 quinone-dependent dihydroorotate dehydrogenase [Nitrospirillum sp. BR 11164]